MAVITPDFKSLQRSRKERLIYPVIGASLLCVFVSGCGSAPTNPPTNPPAVAIKKAPPQPQQPATPAQAQAQQPPATAAPSQPVVAAEPPAPAPQGPAKQMSFPQWLKTFAERASEAGISDATIRTSLNNAQFIPRIVELDRAQPEFTRPPWVYIDNAVSKARIDQGKALIKKHQSLFKAAEDQSGVPASIITAIWGMESNFGRNFGSFRAVDALATLAYDGRRYDWASRELLIALKIIDRGDIPAAQMLGSWAGAMGHTQFLPSAYQRFAVDGDGDGKRDIWGSIPDVIYSTANFLDKSGWRKGETWGVEVVLPKNFDYARAELKVSQHVSGWQAEGVKSVDGRELPNLDNTSIITPAGARGPAILVGDNFRTLLKYNNSINYALAVGLNARQMAGGTGLVTPWPRDLEPLSRTEVRQLQEALNAKGFDTGTQDGVAGPATRIGVRDFQKSAGIPADGYPTKDLLESLLSSAK